MNIKPNKYSIVFMSLLLLFFPVTFVLGQYAGENVNLSGHIKENVYAAGSSVQVHADVDGDVVVAGGRVVITRQISGDVLAAGGNVDVQGNVHGDVRIAGGQLTIDGPIGGDAVAAGGDIVVSPNTTVGGRAWLAGGEINVAGTLDQTLAAAGGVIVISGHIHGDVNLRGEHIKILPGADIEGQLIYYSPQEASIDPQVHIGGKVIYHPVKSEKPTVALLVGIGLVLFFSLLVTGIVLYLLFPRFAFSAARSIRSDPGKSISLGLGLFITIPFTAFLLFSTLIGFPLALLLLAVYFIFLVSGFLTAMLFLGDVIMRMISRSPEDSKGKAILALIAGLIILIVVKFIPFLGVWLEFIALLFGLGALSIKTYRTYVGENTSA